MPEERFPENEIRTRGPLRGPLRSKRIDSWVGSSEQDAVNRIVRTSGAPQGTGDASNAAYSASESSVKGLAGSLHDEVREFPITLVLLGWPAACTREFATILCSSAWPDDALWLVRRDQEGSATDEVGEMRVGEVSSIVLDRSNDTDARLYSNLVADLLFLPAEEESALALVEWRGRARTIVVDSRGKAAEEVQAAAWAAGERCYRWNGGDELR